MELWVVAEAESTGYGGECEATVWGVFSTEEAAKECLTDLQAEDGYCQAKIHQEVLDRNWIRNPAENANG